MKLVVTHSGNQGLLPLGTKVSLQTNGTFLRVWEAQERRLIAELEDSRFHWHTSDRESECDVQGWWLAGGVGTRVRFTVKHKEDT